MLTTRRVRATVLIAALTLAACSRRVEVKSQVANDTAKQHPEWPPTALVGTYEEMVASAKLVNGPSDGGGRAWLEPKDPPSARCGDDYSAKIVYEAGELGVADGGAIFLQVSPFWGWSTPQVRDEGASGFARVSTEASGVKLECETAAPQLLAIHVEGRALKSGERVVIEYGCGVRKAHADDFAELDSRFWIAVDGDGDGTRKVLADSPHVAVLPREPAILAVDAPSVVAPGERFTIHVALLDEVGNACRGLDGSFEFMDAPPELELQVAPSLAADTANSISGHRTIDAKLASEGTYRLRVRCRIAIGDSEPIQLETESNPIVVSSNAPRILWGDLHGHSGLSDGTGTPDEWYEFARDYAALDVVALTDHDHWGILPLDLHRELVDEIVAAARKAERPGMFTALVGFEWTSWIWGHRNVVYFDDEREILSSIDERFDTPQKLWSALRDKPAIAIPHHCAGGPIAIDWRNAGDPEVEPLVEICSAHGSSEALDSPKSIYSPRPGCFARDALDRGLALGFLASGDSHDGHPGSCHLGAHYPTGGVAAILATANTRAAILEALRARRVYATSGPRIVLRFALGTHRMGESVAVSELGSEPSLYVSVVGTAPIESIEIIRSGDRISRFDGEAKRELVVTGKLPSVAPGDWVYARIVQTDGGMAWSSPIFAR